MLQHPTLDQLKHLKLQGMARAFAELSDNPQAGELDHAQWLALLLDREEAERNDRRLTYRLRNARLRHADAAIEDIDYRTPRRLDRALVQQLYAKITNIDKQSRKFSFSIKAREIADEKEAVQQYGSSDSGASLGDILGAALKEQKGE